MCLGLSIFPDFFQFTNFLISHSNGNIYHTKVQKSKNNIKEIKISKQKTENRTKHKNKHHVKIHEHFWRGA